MELQWCGRHGVPSIDTFFPSARLVSMRGRSHGKVARTDGELHLCGPAGRGSKGPGAMVACRGRRPLQRPDQLLPQHGVARAMAMGVEAPVLTLTMGARCPRHNPPRYHWLPAAPTKFSPSPPVLSSSTHSGQCLLWEAWAHVRKDCALSPFLPLLSALEHDSPCVVAGADEVR